MPSAADASVFTVSPTLMFQSLSAELIPEKPDTQLTKAFAFCGQQRNATLNFRPTLDVVLTEHDHSTTGALSGLSVTCPIGIGHRCRRFGLVLDKVT